MSSKSMQVSISSKTGSLGIHWFLSEWAMRLSLWSRIAYPFSLRFFTSSFSVSSLIESWLPNNNLKVGSRDAEA